MHEGMYTGPSTTHSPSSSLFFPIGAQVQHRHGDIIKHGHWTWYHLTVPKVLLPRNLSMHVCALGVHIRTRAHSKEVSQEKGRRTLLDKIRTKLGLEVYKCFNLSGQRLHGHVNLTNVHASSIPYSGKLLRANWWKIFTEKTFADRSLVPPKDATPQNFAEKNFRK